MSRARIALLIIVSILIDATLVLAGAYLLWNGGGTTVAQGTWWSMVVYFLATTALLIARITMMRTAAATASARNDLIAASVEAALLVSAVATWALTSNYFVGWVASYASLFLLLASICQLLVALVAPSPRPPVAAPAHTEEPLSDNSTRTPSNSGRARLHLGTALIALAALATLTTIHNWDIGIFNVLVVLILGAVILATVASAWLTAVLRRDGRGQAPAPARPVTPQYHRQNVGSSEVVSEEQ